MSRLRDRLTRGLWSRSVQAVRSEPPPTCRRMITEEPVGPTETLTIDQGLAAYLRASRRSSKVPSGNAAEKQRGATYAILLTQSRCLRERGLEPLPNQVSRAIDSDKAEVSGSSPLRPTLRPTRFPWSEAVSGRGGLVVAPQRHSHRSCREPAWAGDLWHASPHGGEGRRLLQWPGAL